MFSVEIPMTHTFQAAFGRFTCTITFDPVKHSHGEQGYGPPDKQWLPPPTEADLAAHFPAYREWIHTVYSAIAAIIDDEYRAIIQDRHPQRPKWEAWIYQPDGSAKCVAQGGGLFEPYRRRQN